MSEALTSKPRPKKNTLPKKTLRSAYELMRTAISMAEIYEQNAKVTSKYVHATSRGHEAIQLALGLQLLPQDYVAPYYRDDSILLGIGMSPYELMLQVFAKKDDPFSGGRTYYCHPSLNEPDKPKIPHQSSATGMQAITTTGVAMGVKYLENQGLAKDFGENKPVTVCSLGDASITEGEVAEAFQMAVLKKLPILYLVQDNEWDISAHAREVRSMNALEYAKGFKGLEAHQVNGSDFVESYNAIKKILASIRKERRPILLHAKVPLLNHHTSGVRKEWYRSQEDLAEHQSRDAYPIYKQQLVDLGFSKKSLNETEEAVREKVQEDFLKAQQAEDPSPEELTQHIFAPTPISEEKGNRSPGKGEKVVMVDAALHAVDEILRKHP